MNYPSSIHLTEVGLRDGIQNEPNILTLEEKKELIDALLQAGVKDLEVGSYVNPKAVPQMANTAELVAQLPVLDDVRYRALWLNARGLDQAVAAGKLHLEGNLIVTASEAFVQRNQNRNIDQVIAEMPEWIERYVAAGVAPDGIGVMAAFGCNFEGDIAPQKVIELLARVAELLPEGQAGLKRVILADTMGWGTPKRTRALIEGIRNRWPTVKLKMHLHDTRGTAMSNTIAAMELGVREFDTAVGGLGGCPFAGHKGAAGNVSTEDLVFMCNEMGIETGIDLDRLLVATALAERLVGHPVSSKVYTGGTRARFAEAKAA